MIAVMAPPMARASGLSLPTIVRMEGRPGPGRSAAANVEAVRSALAAAGVVFIAAEDGAGPGVRLKADE